MKISTDKLIEDVLKEANWDEACQNNIFGEETMDKFRKALKFLVEKIQEEEIIGEKEMKNRAIGYDLGYEKAKQEMEEETIAKVRDIKNNIEKEIEEHDRKMIFSRVTDNNHEELLSTYNYLRGRKNAIMQVEKSFTELEKGK